jgi:hypothetical protein
MASEPARPSTPDLFSPVSAGEPSAQSENLPSTSRAITQGTETGPQRHILPKNLRHAVSQLSDGELDEFFEAAFDEAKRRGRLPPKVGTDSTPSSRRPSNLVTKRSSTDKRRQLDIADVPLTRGQLNAVRAAFKAGITPSRIARQFGISQANVRKALAPTQGNQ